LWSQRKEVSSGQINSNKTGMYATEKFVDTTGVIRRHKSKKDRQYIVAASFQEVGKNIRQELF
jgi:hypothetical protein